MDGPDGTPAGPIPALLFQVLLPGSTPTVEAACPMARWDVVPWDGSLPLVGDRC
jgi:hypothetical protein